MEIIGYPSGDVIRIDEHNLDTDELQRENGPGLPRFDDDNDDENDDENTDDEETYI